jgi:hypothetical protein
MDGSSAITTHASERKQLAPGQAFPSSTGPINAARTGDDIAIIDGYATCAVQQTRMNSLVASARAIDPFPPPINDRFVQPNGAIGSMQVATVLGLRQPILAHQFV